MVIVSYLRFTAGVCVLATGLLLGGAGEAIAVAAPDSDGSATHGSNGADGSTQGRSPGPSTAKSPTSIVGDTVRATVGGVTSALGSGRISGPQASTGPTSPKALYGATDTGDAGKDAEPVGAVPDSPTPLPQTAAPATSDGSQPSQAVPPATDVVAQTTDGAGPAPDAADPAPNAGGPTPNAGAPAPDAATPAGNVDAQTPDAGGPVKNVLAQDLITPVTEVVALLPNLVAPVITGSVAGLVTLDLDVISAVQDVFTSAVSAVFSIAQVPFNLASLLGVAGAAEPAMNPRPNIDAYGLRAAANAPVLGAPSAPSPLLLPLSGPGISAVPLARDAAGLGILAGIPARVGPDSSPPATGAQGPDATGPRQLRFHFGQAVATFVVTASLAALAAAALPGIGGLGIFTAAGIRIGQRQAKAGCSLQTAGIGRFARPGPLGVVRSGQLVALHRRTPGVERGLDKVA